VVPLGVGPLLGAFTARPHEVVTTLAPECAVLYTDGVTDARSVTGERFGDDRLVAAIDAARAGSSAEIVESITGAVDRFQAGMLPADDVTLVVIARKARLTRRRVVDYATR
jgi:serine phosphatase RsbU (regulator of sigma subunit)